MRGCRKEVCLFYDVSWSLLLLFKWFLCVLCEGYDCGGGIWGQVNQNKCEWEISWDFVAAFTVASHINLSFEVTVASNSILWLRLTGLMNQRFECSEGVSYVIQRTYLSWWLITYTTITSIIYIYYYYFCCCCCSWNCCCCFINWYSWRRKPIRWVTFMNFSEQTEMHLFSVSDRFFVENPYNNTHHISLGQRNKQ